MTAAPLRSRFLSIVVCAPVRAHKKTTVFKTVVAYLPPVRRRTNFVNVNAFVRKLLDELWDDVRRNFCFEHPLARHRIHDETIRKPTRNDRLYAPLHVRKFQPFHIPTYRMTPTAPLRPIQHALAPPLLTVCQIVYHETNERLKHVHEHQTNDHLHMV